MPIMTIHNRKGSITIAAHRANGIRCMNNGNLIRFFALTKEMKKLQKQIAENGQQHKRTNPIPNPSPSFHPITLGLFLNTNMGTKNQTTPARQSSSDLVLSCMI